MENKALNLFNERKRLLLFYFAIIILYGIIVIIGRFSTALRMLEFGYLMMVFGLAPAFYIRKIFPYDNIIGWLTNASAIGLIFSPFVFLLFGWLGINFIFVYSTFYLYLVAILSALSILFISDQSEITQSINFGNITIIDCFFYGIIVGLTVLLSIQNFSSYYPRWDTFTFWGIDAKYIHDQNQLRTTDFDMLSRWANLSSYYPVLIALAYDLYGQVVEQFASWINVFMHFIAMVLIYNRCLKQSVIKKLLIITVLILVSYTADSIAFMFSLYADTFVAFLALVFVLVLTSDFQFTPQRFVSRFGFLLVMAFSFTFTKDRFFFFSLAVSLVAVVYDYRYWLSHWKRILFQPYFLFMGITLVSVWFIQANYHTNLSEFFQRSSWNPVTSITVSYSLSSYVKYMKDLFSFLLIKTPYIFFLWLIGVVSILIKNHPFKHKKYMFVYLLTFAFFLLFIFRYIITQIPIQTQSLKRYTSIVMYLIPFLYSFQSINFSTLSLKQPKSKDFQYFYIVIAAVLVFISASGFENKINATSFLKNPINFVSGSYVEAFPYHTAVADEVLAITGENANILIVNRADISNHNPPALYVRYFLMYNSAGGQYRTSVNNLISYAKTHKADHVLILEYRKTIPNCDHFFEEGQNYLIEFNNKLELHEGECIFSESQIFALTN